MPSSEGLRCCKPGCFVAAHLLLLAYASAWAQTVASTIAVGQDPVSVAVNPVTNQIYVANFGQPYTPTTATDCGLDPGLITVIDGATKSATGIRLSYLQWPVAVAVNSATDTAYVVSWGAENLRLSGYCNAGFLTSIDGATLTASGGLFPWGLRPLAVAVNEVTGTVYVTESDRHSVHVSGYGLIQVGSDPFALAINATTNKVYVANRGSNNVSVIDGATNLVSTLADPNAITPVGVAVNPTTNKIYVANQGSNNVTVIDGTTGSIASAADAQAISPAAVAVNSTTNKIYVINTGSNNVTVIDGATNAIATVAVGVSPIAIAVNPETNRIYVANNGDSNNPGSVTVINGATDSTTSLTDPNAIKPTAVAVYPLADEAYIANSGSNNVTVIASENFSLVPASAKITVQRGGQATDLLTIAGTNGPFGMSVKLTCTVTAGASQFPSCALSPNSVTPGTGSASSTLTISAAASDAQLSLQNRRQFGVPLYALFLPLVLGTTLLSNSRRRPRSSAVLCGSLVGFLLLLGACWGPSATSQGAKNYTVTVSGASGAIQHTAQVAVTVQ